MLKHRKFHIIKEPAYCRLTSYDNVIKTSTYTCIYIIRGDILYLHKVPVDTVLSSVIAVSCIHIIVTIFSVGVRLQENCGNKSPFNIQSFKCFYNVITFKDVIIFS